VLVGGLLFYVQHVTVGLLRLKARVEFVRSHLSFGEWLVVSKFSFLLHSVSAMTQWYGVGYYKVCGETGLITG
jgi:hypothetical protein